MRRDESKLPAWAQQELADLRRKIANLEDHLRHANERLRQATGEEPSPISWTSGAAVPSARHGHLPADAAVRFRLTDTHLGWVQCTLSRDGGRLVLDVLGGEQIRVRPLSGNHVTVEPE